MTTKTPIPTAAHSEAWAFVLRHRGMIRGFCARWFGGLPDLDREEAASAAILRIVEQYPKLRLDGARNPAAVISTWLGFQVRATLTTIQRGRNKAARAGVGRLVEVGGAVAIASGRSGEDGEAMGVPVAAPEDVEPGARLDAEDPLSQVEALWYVATPRQRAAMASHLRGDTASQVREVAGFRTLRERDAILRTLQPAAEA